MADPSSMWTCPECGKRFVSPGMWHSCGDHTVDQFLAGKSEGAIELWDRLVEVVERCGPVELHAAKTRIGFMVRTRFVSVIALSDDGMTVTIWLKRQSTSPRFRKVEHLGGRDWVHHLRVGSVDDLDDEIQDLLCESYRVGCQEI